MSEDKQFEFINRPISPCGLLDQEKRIRRQIANSNERRRMQSINSGFQALSTLLPLRKGVKLSKAAILQSTTDYMIQLKEENVRLMERVNHLTSIISSNIPDSNDNYSGSPLPKIKRMESVDCVDEENGCSTLSQSERDGFNREIIELRLQLEHEKALVLIKEQQLRKYKSRLYSDSAMDDDAIDQIPEHYHSSAEELDKYSIGEESLLKSPQSLASSQNIESYNEKSPRRSSLELSLDAPNDFSERNVLLRSDDERSLSDTTIPGVIVSPSDSITESFPVDSDNTSRQADCIKSTSRQNLERIIEAIKHVDGDHMFCDDPVPKQSKLTCSVNRSAIIVALRQEETQPKSRQIICPNLSFPEKIPRSTALNPSNPGVIVSNHF